MQGTIRYGDRDIEIADVDDWDFGEVAEAENAFGIDLDEARTSQRIQMGVFISIRRVEKTIPAGALADEVRRMKFTSTVTEKDDEDAAPLGAEGNGHVEAVEPVAPRTTGSLSSGASST